MTLRKNILNIINKSQALPGFGTIEMRPFLLGGVFLVGFLLISGFGNTPKDFTFEVPKAEASASLAKGMAEPVFTRTQTRYIQRALNARHDNLYKLQGASVRAAFNEPELVRSDIPTTVWQYRNQACVLDIYFKSDDADVTYAPVVHYEVRNRANGDDVSPADIDTCLKSMLPASSGAAILNVSSFYKG